MKRDLLIQQVKDEYARLADLESQQHVTNQSYSRISSEAYYEQALEQAIRDISAGKYDDCVSGFQVVEHIANNKPKVNRIQDTIEFTLHNMEIDNKIMALETDNKKINDLKEANQRRAEAIPPLIREMKEEQAREELTYDSPNIIGGGRKK